MGWYTNYEVEFDEVVDWDDLEVKKCIEPMDCRILYLRDFTKPRIVICIYSHHDIRDILAILYDLYFTDMRYTMYSLEMWEKYKN